MSKRFKLIAVCLALVVGIILYVSARNNPDMTGSSSAANHDTPVKNSGGVLDLSGNQLTQLPLSALERSDVITLNVSNNQLMSLPLAINSIVNLEVLNIENNRLEGSLPEEIGQLTKLREIRANNNRMTGIPVSIGQLASLRTADFSNNRIVSIPSELGKLSQLEYLDLSGNNISEKEINQLRTLLPNTELKF